MFALGLISNLANAAGPTKEESKAEADRQQQIVENRDATEKANDDKRRERLAEEGGEDASKENQDSNVCM